MTFFFGAWGWGKKGLMYPRLALNSFLILLLHLPNAGIIGVK